MDTDQKFQGGGTPIGSLIPQQQPQQNLPPAYQQQPYQQPHQNIEPDSIQYQHHNMERHSMENQYHQRPQQQQSYSRQSQTLSKKDIGGSRVESNGDRFSEIMGMSVLQFVILVILICVINSPLVLGFEKNFLPLSLRVGEPPYVIIIFNALLIVLLYAGINKLKVFC